MGLLDPSGCGFGPGRRFAASGVIFVTHVQGEAMSISDLIVGMKDGKLYLGVDGVLEAWHARYKPKRSISERFGLCRSL